MLTEDPKHLLVHRFFLPNVLILGATRRGCAMCRFTGLNILVPRFLRGKEYLGLFILGADQRIYTRIEKWK